MAQPNRTVDEQAVAIGASVCDCLGHLPEGGKRSRLTPRVKYASYSTHVENSHRRALTSQGTSLFIMSNLGIDDRHDLHMSDSCLHSILACPNCKQSLLIGDEIICSACGASYTRMPHALNLMPRPDARSSEIWTSWAKLQENGVVSYEQDPDRNLAVGEREDCSRFSRFCGFSGLVLDVGCGPQPWPAYLSESAAGTVFCGVDPLVGGKPGKYTRVRGLAEYLPFRNEAFSHVVFATTLDHFVSPYAGLVEARRVVTSGGTIEVWLGQKAEDAPAPDKSHDWYDQLIKPAGADDVFHMERLDEAAAIDLFNSAGLQVVERESHQSGDYRTDNFFRLAVV